MLNEERSLSYSPSAEVHGLSVYTHTEEVTIICLFTRTDRYDYRCRLW